MSRNATYDRFVKGCPRVILVPIIDSLDVTGRNGVILTGFAAFLVEGSGRSGKRLSSNREIH